MRTFITGSSRTGAQLGHAFRHGDARGGLERGVRRVHRVIGTVDQSHADIHHRKAERALLEIIGNAFLDRGDEVARHHARL